MQAEYYEAIFKRKSIRKYDKALKLTAEELADITKATQNLAALAPGIAVRLDIVNRAETTAKWGEYCLLFYSEKKPGYLLNAGYMLEQMDLLLASRDIGACWFGMARPRNKSREGLDYVMMLAFGKSQPQDFRNDAAQFTRKEAAVVWQGAQLPLVSEAVRLAPSACNRQPWRASRDGNRIDVACDNTVRSIIPPSHRPFFNGIDMGIYLCFLEIALAHAGYSFERELAPAQSDREKMTPIARYTLETSASAD